jgi:ribosomal protein RSM22 (predicted rRNA methylase)
LEKGKQEVSMKQLEIHVEGESKPNIEVLERLLPEARIETAGLKGEELRDQLRREAYQWPRLVFPPLKKSGHIILDACTAEGMFHHLVYSNGIHHNHRENYASDDTKVTR